MKILIVEDTEDSRLMLEMVMSSHGYEVMSGVDGIEALRLARATPPDLIISDILMPEMDGFEFCRQIKADPELQDIPFLFYTATYTEPQDRELAMALGACRFLVKPVVPKELVAIVEEVWAEYTDGVESKGVAALKGKKELDEMHLHSLTIKLDKKVRELEEERLNLKELNDELEQRINQRTVELQGAKEAAEAASRAKSIFLANMSHEFRTPLSAILGFAQIMQDDPAVTESQNASLEIIDRSGKHLLQLINDVLDMSKIEAGHLALHLEDFDLGELVRDVTDMILVQAKEKGVQLILDQSSSFPRIVHGDSSKLRQILINLLSNAVRFTESGGVTLRLDADDDHSGSFMLRGEVEDSGPGISPENIERIFTPFERLTESVSQNGAGLGLAITRQFVELMNGDITAETLPGNGSLFCFNVQVQPGDDEHILNREMNMSRVVGLQPGQPEYRVLVVEDQLDNQRLLQRLLEEVGFKICIAGNGEEAIDIFQQWHPHFIWMDRRMPVMDGLIATRRIRELPGGDRVKIVALTASVFKEQKNEVLESGADDFVSKPYKSGDIFHCLANHLDIHYLYEERQYVVAPAEDKPVMAIDSGALAVLPDDLLTELRTATMALDMEQTLAVIEEVKEVDASLAVALQRLVEDLNFNTLQQLLEENK